MNYRSPVRLSGVHSARGSLAFCFLVVLSLAGCGRSSQPVTNGPEFIDRDGELTVPGGSPLRTHLRVSPVALGAEAAAISFPATVDADPASVVNVLAPLTGRVIALKVDIGDYVKQGQVLAVVASGDMAQAYTDLDKANDGLQLAQKALTRARGVLSAGGAADKDLEAAQSTYNQAKAEQARARTRVLALNGTQHSTNDEMVLTAAENGVITALAIGPGAQVNDPTATLMTITNTDRVFVTANLPENDIGTVLVGAEAKISFTAYPGKIFRGRVSAMNTVLEPDTRRQKLRIVVDNRDGRLLPNMYATVFFTEPAQVAVSVPQSALLMNNDTISVLREIRPWVFERQVVRIGDETDASAQVLSGLKPGDRVVVRGGILLND